MLECVVNISEGRDAEVLARIAGAGGDAVLDVHRDAHHHRTVLTLAGADAVRAVATRAVEALDLRGHDGVHPRLGVVDVVPFVALAGSTAADALAARDAFAAWFASRHGVPCFLYGPERTLPEVRRHAFRELAPDVGPAVPHVTAGATAVGQRGVLVAYNVWLSGTDLATAVRLAGQVRRPGIRALGLTVGDRHRVSMNLIDPATVGPATAFDAVASAADGVAEVSGAELVGLVPRAVLDAVPTHRWAELDLAADRTIEARLEAAGLA